MTKAFGAIGIGLSFRVLANELEEATKAAVEDRKSQELLALAMINTGNATDATVKSAEASIAKMQIQAGIADDKLRPAFQKLFIATGDVTQSNKLMQIALDASAATGKDLETVTQAMAKSLAGNDAALAKLIPSLKGSKNPIEEMGAAFKGASSEAANLDPYQRMQVIFGEIQERIGTALLPVLDDLAAWLMSPPGQQQIQDIAEAVRELLVSFTDTAKWAIANKDWLIPVVAGIGAITTAIKLANAAMLVFNATTKLNPFVVAGTAILGVAAYTAELSAPDVNKTTTDIIKKRTSMIPSADVVSGIPNINRSVSPRVAERGNVNITINTPKVNAQDIVNTINNAQKNGYTGQITMPTR
jgi:hypothetical protein